jgi:hypothetical protein
MHCSTENQQVKEFESLLEDARQQLLFAQSYFDIWEQLWPTKQTLDAINYYKRFFMPTRIAISDQFFIRVYELCSNSPSAPSFYRLLGMVNKYKQLAPNLDGRSIRKQIKKHKNLLKRIEVYRNKRAAHFDTQETEIEHVMLGESRTLLQELEDIFNKVQGEHKNATWEFQLLEHNDTLRLLNQLKKKYTEKR